jgi:hypothetical protein
MALPGRPLLFAAGPSGAISDTEPTSHLRHQRAIFAVMYKSYVGAARLPALPSHFGNSSSKCDASNLNLSPRFGITH